MFISLSGEWRLGGFEVLSSVMDDDAVIYVSAPILYMISILFIDISRRHMEASSLTLVAMLPLKLRKQTGTQ